MRHAFPEMNLWLDEIPDPRVREMCTYSSRHIQWQAIATFLLRDGSRNAFDADRNSGAMPENLLRLGGEVWDEERLGVRRTVTCSGNVVHHLERVSTDAFATLPLRLAGRLTEMRLLDRGRLFGHWWMIAVDGTLMDRGRESDDGPARYRYVVEAVLVGPSGLRIPLMSEFADMRDPVRDKEDCELNAFLRLTERLKREFPRLPVCLLLDGLYPVKAVFDRCRAYQWKFIATLREGRQPTAWDDAVQIMMMSPANVRFCRRRGEHGEVEQTMRWSDSVPFGEHAFQVIFLGEIGSESATLWAWTTNLLVTPERAEKIVNDGGRARQEVETLFNVEKNGGFGLEHAFCANITAAHNLHVFMQVAYVLGQLLVNGMLRRLTRACRKVSDVKLIEMLRSSLAFVPIPPDIPPVGQLRFQNSS